MPQSADMPRFAAIIVAAGSGTRARQAVPKQYVRWRGKPVLRHSAEALLAAGAEPLVIAIAPNAADMAREALAGLDSIILVDGGATRRASVSAGLEALAGEAPEHVLIHDAARPTLPQPVIDRVLAALAGHPGSIPTVPVVDTIARMQDGVMTGQEDRTALARVQTPQGFRFADILSAHRAWDTAHEPTDDAQVLRAYGGEVAVVAGDERLAKLTFAEDFAMQSPPVRMGTGFDVHQLAEGEELWLGGIRIEHDKGLAGHSDADVALHALVDAILGAMGHGDIGTHFPPSDEQWRGAASGRFLEHVVSLAAEAGYAIGNLDLTIICEAPKIGPHKDAMREKIAQFAGVQVDAVSVKATTTERLGFTGRGEGIAAQAAATLIREDFE
ncbi:bifunctional 2-C-methyl-D-erythritol 4-phosphate cytidylyltransferase/2-C-methyl-D-erythritol 2,4-cyclodiphosphate synthase [Alteriqipengyuania lutimaris]|uniref:Bifunctional enzyme IspD/IspF n=1 Tax=Alteriqipengyuania lutimaris TaxID=1538146 RepID=A0A395LLZ0_9SPHN|nr:bifunctional 2-C-methyl-D-erythritol 4-phosphate cytidylyltransferase/2-C-methyl-D-erythritol 2,4-cyclodiphosphate synthase [Alteriqipengyuania lutimaris]MBB3032853.1 2-C-methyl-D-erythritol 4-phosphate cytidylyltransferase/2-C-methyl-D-erythritol 2,4-cyclodiphosphate synthase [Alteriqipengyuania lutimaris]RDS78053.1 bifunctional 2-C-methyl-D-erythritol 4-phosphate cytidylyltransferase/2-C-methyl-D-erythritol 2,4-cyclodiphosphate synthase [Alteriqipengyuania lutimaris]